MMDAEQLARLRARADAAWAVAKARLDPRRWDEIRAAYRRAEEEGR